MLFRLLLLCSALNAAVVSRDWVGGKLALKLDDGSAELEWISPVAFRFARAFGNSTLPAAHISHEAITPTFEDTAARLSMKSRYLTVEIDRADGRLHVRSGETPVTEYNTSLTAGNASIQFVLKPDERIFGLLGGGSKLNIRGETLERRHGFLFTSAGFGIYMESPEPCTFDLASGTIQSRDTSIEFDFYYGPTAKEVMEQHETGHPHNEVKAPSLDVLSAARLPQGTVSLPRDPVRTWDAFAALVRTINHWSLSAVIYPALDLSIFDSAPREIKERAADLSSMFPIVYRSSGEGGIDTTTREAWTPYLITYLREAYDRGYPLIRPLPMEFSRDASSEKQADVFMLGDEVLLAPVLGAGTKRRLDLPRGNWTDVRTNAEYRGNQTVEVDAPPGCVPMFVRNGWIIPLSFKDRMELHYYPSLGGEFFLWEPDLNENSQFHAAPAGDFVRVEIESQKRRTYEWILHHTKAPREVAEDAGAYQRVAARDQLKPGTWWHDDSRNDLHILLHADPKTDRIVNISFE